MQISHDLLKKYKSDYNKHPHNKAVAGAIARTGLQEASYNNEALKKHNFHFSHETKRGKITSQKSSGRCWMFAALNTARVKTMEELNLENIEFSQNYTLFWDKLEKSNYFLEGILETLDEPRDGRLVAHLLNDPVQDGGQWDMFSGILEKYGAVPKDAMPETFHSSNTAEMVSRLTCWLRKYAQILRSSHEEGYSMDELRRMKEEFLSEIYAILVKCLGEVPEKFDFEYRDKDKEFHKDENLSPREFFKKYIGWNLDEKISLIHAPTADKPYGRAYTVKFLGTVKEARPICYINVPIEVLKDAAIKSIKAGAPVWFGCDVQQMSARKDGYMDMEMYNYDLTLGELPPFTKAQRLDYGESMLTHAMVFTGVDLDAQGQPIKWQVENSWGEDVGDKGMFSMSDAWFDEFNYQIMVEKKYVEPKWLKALDEPVIELEPWDPMGALALVK